jgi:hypothetical protein
VAKLPPKVKLFIVERVAAFEPPSAVVQAVQDEFGLRVRPQLVETYDPTKTSSRGLGKRWRDLFHAKRAEYIADIDRIGIRHRANRLRALDRVAREAEAAKNRPLVLQAVEMAAKEVGDVFTNRRATEMTGAGGGPIQATATFVLDKLSDEDLDALHRELLRPDEEDEA